MNAQPNQYLWGIATAEIANRQQAQHLRLQSLSLAIQSPSQEMSNTMMLRAIADKSLAVVFAQTVVPDYLVSEK
jgi:hypothetical protein